MPGAPKPYQSQQQRRAAGEQLKQDNANRKTFYKAFAAIMGMGYDYLEVRDIVDVLQERGIFFREE